MDKSVVDKDTPVVTVLMSVYNGEEYLASAIQSILEQSFSLFEFLIINDGSTDKSAEIISSFNDSRIRLISNEKNQGLINSLNSGLAAARGDFIARMDADDICYPERLQKQVQFFYDNKEVGVCGTWVKILGSDTVYKYPLTGNEIRAFMLLNNPMAHPSVMFRRRLFRKYGLSYDINFPGAEDYELWTRAIFKTGFANIPEPLVKYRRHDQQVTQDKIEIVVSTTRKIKLQFLKNFHLQPSDREITIHLFLFNDEYKELRIPGIIPEADRWLYKIFSANIKLKIIDECFYSKIWRTRLFITAVKQYDFTIWNYLFSSYCFRFSGVNTIEKISLFIKCLIKRKVG